MALIPSKPGVNWIRTVQALADDSTRNEQPDSFCLAGTGTEPAGKSMFRLAELLGGGWMSPSEIDPQAKELTMSGMLTSAESCIGRGRRLVGRRKTENTEPAHRFFWRASAEAQAIFPELVDVPIARQAPRRQEGTWP